MRRAGVRTLTFSSMVEELSEPPLAKRRRLKLSLSRCRPPSALPQPDDETTENGTLGTLAEAAVGSEGEEEAYFSANFKTVCGAVLAEDCAERRVFTDSDRDTVERFMSLPGAEQQLYVRLFLRKHQWLRLDKLRYDRIAEDLVPIASGLVSKNFLLSESGLSDRREALNLLQVSELKQLGREMRMAGSLQRCQKSEILQALFTHSQQHRPLFGAASFLDVVFKRAKVLLGRCVCMSPEPVEVFSKCLLLHSLTTSLSSSWTEEGDSAFSDTIYKMLQVKIGQLVFYDYEVYITDPLFPSAEEFSRFYEASKDLRTIVGAVENRADKDEIMSLVERARKAFQRELTGGPTGHGFMEKMTTGWVLAKTLTSCVEYLEKRGEYGGAVGLLQLLLGQSQYGRSLRGHWLERLSLNLDFHLKERRKCLEVIKGAVMEESGLHPARRLSLTQRAHRILQTLSRPKSRKSEATDLSRGFSPDDFPQPDITPAKEVVIEAQRYSINNRPHYAIQSQEDPETYSFVSVEGLAMHHYSSAEAWPCAVHAEKSTFSLMFSLLMWDIIFYTGVPNVFRSKLQAGPLDLLTDDFYTRRQELIETRLNLIKLSTIEELGAAVEECWERNHGLVCHGADWEVLPSLQDAKSLAVCMGGELLSKVCRQFAMFYRQSCGGLPDLTLWNPTTTSCKFVEVKGPGDKLSHKQIVWLSRLSSWGCAVEVCRVKGKLSLLNIKYEFGKIQAMM